ncbi:hypothetical protein AGLY_011717 [Aphis glycines]|uniref:Uncharacterized protein n=1 Tax=Aphis glycines TaxID=307491 RepID=A0A6G0TBL7_APHGL|nr:hypothetical protein AGLY_011717 [Aphis glycines]
MVFNGGIAIRNSKCAHFISNNLKRKQNPYVLFLYYKHLTYSKFVFRFNIFDDTSIYFETTDYHYTKLKLMNTKYVMSYNVACSCVLNLTVGDVQHDEPIYRDSAIDVLKIICCNIMVCRFITQELYNNYGTALILISLENNNYKSPDVVMKLARSQMPNHNHSNCFDSCASRLNRLIQNEVNKIICMLTEIRMGENVDDKNNRNEALEYTLKFSRNIGVNIIYAQNSHFNSQCGSGRKGFVWSSINRPNYKDVGSCSKDLFMLEMHRVKHVQYYTCVIN